MKTGTFLLPWVLTGSATVADGRYFSRKQPKTAENSAHFRQSCENLDLQQPKCGDRHLYLFPEIVSFDGFCHFTIGFQRGSDHSLKLVILGPFSGPTVIGAARTEKTRTYSNLNVPATAKSDRFAAFCSFSLHFTRFACLPARF